MATTCELALNKGPNNGDSQTQQELDYYVPKSTSHFPTDGVDDNGRKWGPSSQHSGVVIHGLGDGSVTSIQDGVDPNTYLHKITRAGGEPISE